MRTAHGGASALRLIAWVRPRVAILDYHLPDLTEQLRQRFPGLPIVMMSGALSGVETDALRMAGVRVFINKPAPLGPLRQAVVQLLRSAPSTREANKPKNWFSGGLGSEG